MFLLLENSQNQKFITQNRKKEQVIYEVEYERCKVSKEIGHDVFMEEIASRQKKRKDDRKIKRNRNEVSMKEYIDDYFMRQLGYSLLR